MITLYAGIALSIPFYESVFDTLKLAHLGLDEDIEASLGLVLRSYHARTNLWLNYYVPYKKYGVKNDKKGNNKGKKKDNKKAKRRSK